MKTSGDERKREKNSISEEQENYSRQNIITGTLSKDKYLDCTLHKILGTILEVDQRGIKQMDQRTRKLMIRRNALHPMCQEEREEEYSPALKKVLTHRYNDSNTTFKSAEEN